MLGKPSLAVAAAALLLGVAPQAHADQPHLRIVKTPGFSAMPLHVMERQKFLERQLAKAGVPDTKVEWTRISGGALVNDALLAGNVDVAVGGIGPLATIVGRTAGTPVEVKGIAAVVSQPIYLNCNDPRIKSLADLGEKDRIAVPAVKVSIQAVVLQMEAARRFGEKDAHRIDRNTVSIPSADAIAQIVSGAGALTCHMAADPHHTTEVKSGKVHTVLDSYGVVGSPHNISVAYTTKRFRDGNPKLYAAFLAALAEAQAFITADPKTSAAIYLEMNAEKMSADEIEALIRDKKNIFSSVPYGTERIVNFMHKTGAMQKPIGSWKDLYFPDIHGAAGN
ncbi:MAG: ABC transporter substrate-binding protein [Burkholderiales bacterium]|nr:ABC transporter substrate-binding protein [Burkholderiales bacterium]